MTSSNHGKYLCDNWESEKHCFWHQNDDCTLTTLGYVWTYPGQLILDKSIMISNTYINKSDIPVCSGICSDYINKIKYD